MAFMGQRLISRHVSSRTSACSMVDGVRLLCCMSVGWEHGVQDRGCLSVLEIVVDLVSDGSSSLEDG